MVADATFSVIVYMQHGKHYQPWCCKWWTEDDTNTVNDTLLVYQFCRSCNKLKGFIGNLPENNSSPKLIQIIMRGADECKLPYKHAKKWKIAKNWFETLQLKSPLGKRHKGHLSQAYTCKMSLLSCMILESWKHTEMQPCTLLTEKDAKKQTFELTTSSEMNWSCYSIMDKLKRTVNQNFSDKNVEGWPHVNSKLLMECIIMNIEKLNVLCVCTNYMYLITKELN